MLQRRALEKQRASKTALEAEQQAQSGIGGASGGQQAQLLQEQTHLAPQAEVDFQESLIVERESEIRRIEENVNELNVLFRDVATMVHDQGTVLDSIADNVEDVRTDTRGADVELRQASRYQKNARAKGCCLLMILGVVLLVVVLAAVYG